MKEPARTTTHRSRHGHERTRGAHPRRPPMTPLVTETPEDEDDNGSQGCPYCHSSDDCPHLLLFVDVDNHDAQGGLLFEAFNEVWRSFCSQHDDDLERNPPFRDLLEEVDSIASAAPPEFETDQGPGTCFGYRAFYLDSPRERKAAIKKFRAASVDWELRWPPRAGDE